MMNSAFKKVAIPIALVAGIAYDADHSGRFGGGILRQFGMYDAASVYRGFMGDYLNPGLQATLRVAGITPDNHFTR